ncbi:beta-ketoacyl synthase N-terminal-like domain-containing protein [Streptomyces eurythermus]
MRDSSQARARLTSDSSAGTSAATSTGTSAESAAAAPAEAIAVVGMACRLPRAAGPDAFFRLLRDGVDAIREVPADRWDAAEHTGEATDTPGAGTRWPGGVG